MAGWCTVLWHEQLKQHRPIDVIALLSIFGAGLVDLIALYTSPVTPHLQIYIIYLHVIIFPPTGLE